MHLLVFLLILQPKENVLECAQLRHFHENILHKRFDNKFKSINV